MMSRSHLISTFAILMISLLAGCTLPATPTPTLGEPIALVEYYVATSGNDENDCLSPATACAWPASRSVRSCTMWR